MAVTWQKKNVLMVVLFLGVRDRIHPSLRDRDGPPRQVHSVYAQLYWHKP